MNRLRQLREKYDLTISTLSKATGISVQQLSRYERGENNPKIETWQKLAEYFNVSVPYLMGHDIPATSHIECLFSKDIMYNNRKLTELEKEKILQIIELVVEK